ncbi:lectin subunit alpha [Stomoxys calcitrans]|uniref:lectin subunit alpha n=1 Tax=Stomoxys calcitrans TaxID=35570 RepID=UPI0027E3AB05|nr:lectin subunit alpha [Stomoxys calcitrans]
MQNTSKILLQFGLILFLGLLDVSSGASWYTASDGRRYLIEATASYNWLQALDKCTRQDLQLVVIDSDSKNKALISLLRSVFGSARDYWIGHHDEFNRKKDKNRGWYSSTSGASISYGYWDSGEPNNFGGTEHCTQIYRKTDYKWNDEDCDKHSFGYICEEHFKTAQCRSQMEAKRTAAQQKNNQLSSDFVKTKNNVNKIMTDTSEDTDNMLTLWESSSQNVMDNFKESLNELIAKKPYLQAVIADVGPAIKALASEAQVEISKLTEQTRQTIAQVQLQAEKSVDSENTAFENIIADHSNEMDRLMVY